MLRGNKLSCILSIVDAFSSMCWLLPVSDSISAKETGELILRRVMLEDARGLACQIVSDLDQRFIGAAMRHIYTEMTRFDACIEKIDEKTGRYSHRYCVYRVQVRYAER